jgi:hypothetical protein
MLRYELVLVPADGAPVQAVARVIKGHPGHDVFAWRLLLREPTPTSIDRLIIELPAGV